MKKDSVGVLVGRFQIPELHDGHCDIIERVQKKHKVVAIGIGESPIRGTRRDPLPYYIREHIIREQYPNVQVFRIDDHESDHIWSQHLDFQIGLIAGSKPAMLYGSRDSFFPHYKGEHPLAELEPLVHVSGSTVRNKIYVKPDWDNLKDFASGVIYSTQHQYPRIFPTVDVACVRDGKGKLVVALGKKHPKDLLRFPGGFVDAVDTSMEDAAYREMKEEIGDIGIAGGIKDVKYIGSYQVNDWRYKDTEDRIVTTFFYVPYMFGALKAGDDLAQVDWHDINVPIKKIHESHRVLMRALRTYLKIEKED